jgi:hypothetical protein
MRMATAELIGYSPRYQTSRLASGAFASLPKVVYPLWPIDPNLASFDHGSSTGLQVSVSPPDNFAGMQARS